MFKIYSFSWSYRILLTFILKYSSEIIFQGLPVVYFGVIDRHPQLPQRPHIKNASARNHIDIFNTRQFLYYFPSLCKNAYIQYRHNKPHSPFQSLEFLSRNNHFSIPLLHSLFFSFSFFMYSSSKGDTFAARGSRLIFLNTSRESGNFR